MKRTILLSVALFACLVSAVHAYMYDVIDLGVGKAYSINNNGQVVGSSEGQAAFFDSSGGTNTIYLGGNIAYSINSSGDTVGYSGNQPTLFDSTGLGNNIGLGGLPGEPDASGCAYSINDNGQIVGHTSRPGGATEAIHFSKLVGGDNIRLCTFKSTAYSINNSGQIVGYADDLSGKLLACVFDPTSHTVSQYLGTIGGSYSTAYSINDNGEIVGISRNDTGYLRATYFDATGNGGNINLGTLGGDFSVANSINTIGQIVGASNDAADNRIATLFDATGGGENIDLNTLIDLTLGWDLQVANCINDNGWIVGSGLIDGEEHAFLLTPVPEPCTLLLFGLGSLLLRKRP